MSESETEDGRNPTQEAIDEEGASDKPVDVGGWEETEPSPHAGEAGQSDDVA
jgi:hypothetical protein